jgi:hypothetical protein
MRALGKRIHYPVREQDSVSLQFDDDLDLEAARGSRPGLWPSFVARNPPATPATSNPAATLQAVTSGCGGTARPSTSSYSEESASDASTRPDGPQECGFLSGMAGLKPPSVGDTAPKVGLAAHDGSRWRLDDHAGRPVVLIFHRHLA